MPTLHIATAWAIELGELESLGEKCSNPLSDCNFQSMLPGELITGNCLTAPVGMSRTGNYTLA